MMDVSYVFSYVSTYCFLFLAILLKSTQFYVVAVVFVIIIKGSIVLAIVIVS